MIITSNKDLAMSFVIADILTPVELAALQEVMNQPALFTDGKATAGWQAGPRKRNLQADKASPVVKGALRKVESALLKNPVFQSAARPRGIASLLLSRYQSGMQYGTHVDDAMMAGQRTDLSFTLFLSAPESYEGGELVVERTDGESVFKPAAGHLVLYASTALHRVEPVTRGVRFAAVGWVRSLIREEAQRELLFDLDRAVELLRHGGDGALDLILKTRGNLLRRWIED